MTDMVVKLQREAQQWVKEGPSQMATMLFEAADEISRLKRERDMAEGQRIHFQELYVRQTTRVRELVQEISDLKKKTPA